MTFASAFNIKVVLSMQLYSFKHMYVLLYNHREMMYFGEWRANANEKSFNRIIR